MRSQSFLECLPVPTLTDAEVYARNKKRANRMRKLFKFFNRSKQPKGLLGNVSVPSASDRPQPFLEDPFCLESPDDFVPAPSVCAVCELPFEKGATKGQADRHMQCCMSMAADDSMRIIQAAEEWTIRLCWEYKFGDVSTGVIRFDDANESLPFELDAVAASLHILIKSITDDESNAGYEAYVSQTRFRYYAALDRNTFFGISFCPFEIKKKWFYAQLRSFSVDYTTSWVRIVVDGTNLTHSVFHDLANLKGHDFHKEFKIHFEGEEAQDAGGLTREWVTRCSKEIFTPQFGLFLYTDGDFLLRINPSSGLFNNQHLRHFKMVGRLLGKALFDKILMMAPLVKSVLKQILRIPVTLDDLAQFDSHLHQSLDWMMNNPVEGVLYETFSVTEERFGEEVTIDLIPNGRNITVTDSNKRQYVDKVWRYHLIDSTKKQLDAMASGLYEVIPRALLQVFDDQSMELLMNGLPTLDVDDWQINSRYDGEYNETHKVVVWFWQAVRNSLTEEERARLLQFTTGTSKVPAEGFGALESNRNQKGLFTIAPIARMSPYPLPKAHTCFNRLGLPPYKSYDELQKYLHMGLAMDIEGFGLE